MLVKCSLTRGRKTKNTKPNIDEITEPKPTDDIQTLELARQKWNKPSVSFNINKSSDILRDSYILLESVTPQLIIDANGN